MGLNGEVGQETQGTSASKASPPTPLVVVTGCDRGVGLWVAAAVRQWGYKVLAGVLDTRSAGAQYLLGLDVQVLELDVTDEGHVVQLLDVVMDMEQRGSGG
ncbi:NAD(P)-binding domain [Trinorchestia longiramus]|nr:NAD(P)-binding domain [Trinorchestia longiramus]